MVYVADIDYVLQHDGDFFFLSSSPTLTPERVHHYNYFI